MGLVMASLFVGVPSASAQNRAVRRPIRMPKVNVEAAARNAPAAPVESSSSPQPKPALDALIPVTPEGSTDSGLVEQVRRRLAQDADALRRQRVADGLPALPEPPADQPRAMIDMAHYGLQYGNTGPSRFLALHLIVDNPTSEPISIKRDEISARLDGDAKALEDVPDNLKHISFPYGAQHQNVQLPEQVKEIKAPAKGVAGTWLLYAGLPMSPEVPEVSLQLRLGARKADIDVTASQRALLELRSEPIGPRGCLRLLTIHGMMNSVNLQAFVQELERFTEQKTVRFVLQWREGAPPPEQQLSFWLVNSAAQIGSGRPVNEQYPSLPALIREFHFVQPAGNALPNTDQYGRPNAGIRMHATAAEAVGAALKTAFVALPPEELMQAILEGHPLARAAALRYGAAKLNAAHLPLILQRIDDADPDIQTAAVRALGQFSEPASLETLARIARNPKTEALGAAAIESLAGSRYAVAQKVLLDLLRLDDPALKKRIVQVLARYPRPQWSETIYAYVTDPKEQLPLEGIRALLQVGHPRLIDVLEAGLKSPDKSVRDLVFPILAQRSDVRSERLATAYALRQLEEQAPDGTVIQFLHRTKLAQAIPLLVKHLDTAPDKSSIINLLAQIGDETVGDALVARYEKLQNHEKSTALNALRTLRHDKFLPLAGEALLANDGNLISQATQGLIQDAGPEACRLLIQALEKQTASHALSHICNALGNIGSPEAREALLKARSSDNQQKQNYAIHALNYLRQRSPGYQYIWQAQAHSQQKQWKEALEYFELSLQLDPELPEAYAGRGSMRLRLGKTADATKDFEKAYELDPFNAQAVSGLAVVRVQAGKIDEGLKLIESGRERHQYDPAYVYNAACVYAQAMEQIGKEKDLPDRDQRREEYRKKALAELQTAVTRGFSDFDWMRDDPDFKPLRDDPEFKKLVGNRPAPAKEPRDGEPADADPEER
jgi:HEAT repeat protein